MYITAVLTEMKGSHCDSLIVLLIADYSGFSIYYEGSRGFLNIIEVVSIKASSSDNVDLWV